MTKAQTSITFARELTNLGFTIPDGCTGITIKCDKPDDEVFVMYRLFNMGKGIINKKGEAFKYPDGTNVLVKDFYKMIKDDVQLPEETCEFTIEADMDSVVMVNIKAALPEGSLKGFFGAGAYRQAVMDKVKAVFSKIK